MPPAGCGSCLVVGAGIAGISAVKTLREAGFDNVKLLEATDRIGGRIRTLDFSERPLSADSGTQAIGQKAELGATFIHGCESNPIYCIAEENNLLKLRERELNGRKVITVTEDGEELASKVVQELDWHYGMLMQECEEFFTLHKPTPVENDSVGNYMRREIQRYLDKFTGEERHQRETLFNQRLLHEACICGSDEAMDDVSLGEIGSYEELTGSSYMIEHGFESIVNAVKKDIPPDDIYLNHVVTTIRWQTDDNCVHVECENGHTFTADHVIVTVPLGFLKAGGTSMFEPPLPDDKIEAIHHLGFGAVDKIILQFDENVFGDRCRRLDILWNEDILLGDLSDNWHRHIHAFESVGHNLIQAWLTGSSAIHLETLEDEEVIEQCVTILAKFLQKPIPKPKKLIRSRWASHEFTKGSYTYIPIRSSVMDIDVLAEPLPLHSRHPCLLFAGEATHPMFYSTTHGALFTGRREAQRIISLYSKKGTQEIEPDSDDSDAIMF